MAKAGTVYHDIAHLYLHIGVIAAKPWCKPSTVRALQQELLAAFEPGLQPDRPLFALALYQHVLCQLLVLQNATGARVARLYAARLHAMHRRWLAAGGRTRPEGLGGVKILIDSCSYNCQNVGDLAMLIVAVSRLRELWPSASIRVITNAPDLIARHCGDVDTVPVRGRQLLLDERLLGRARRWLPTGPATSLEHLEEQLVLRRPASVPGLPPAEVGDSRCEASPTPPRFSRRSTTPTSSSSTAPAS